jgi:hypothetical protein
MADEKTLQNDLRKFQTELSVPKGQRNTFGNYDYRSCEDILEAVKPMLKSLKCTLTLEDEMWLIGDRYYVKATATLTNNEGVFIKNTGYAREAEIKKGMDAAQITGAASSYARKYALAGLFLLDDNKDADSMDNKPAEEDKPVQNLISPNQVKKLQKMVDQYEVDLEKFCVYFKIKSLNGLDVKHFTTAVKMIEAKAS